MRRSVKTAIAVCIAAICAVFACGCGDDLYDSPDIQPHVIASPDPDYTPSVESWVDEYAMPEISGELTAAQYRDRIDTLYATVVYDKKRPRFAAEAKSDPAYAVYSAALELLSEIILEDWKTSQNGDYEIVHAIHDRLVCGVDYDFALYDEYRAGNTELAGNPAFHIDGALVNKKAVCDGIVRAFDFLCAMENIPAIRITGSYAGMPHAWNKVRVGGNWYNVDVTADIANYYVGGKRYKQLSHGYFLISDDTIKNFSPSSHDFMPPPFAATIDYDYYVAAQPTITVGGRAFSAHVRTRGELDALFSAISAQKGRVGKIEVKLDFRDKTQVNGADVYASEIAASYAKLKDARFTVSSGSKPYFRYPNGVYLFLMY